MLKFNLIIRKAKGINMTIDEIEKKYIRADSNERADMLAAIMQDLILATVRSCKEEKLLINSTLDFKQYFESFINNLISNNQTWKRFMFLMVHNLYNVDKQGIQACFEMYITQAADRYNEIKHLL